MRSQTEPQKNKSKNKKMRNQMPPALKNVKTKLQFVTPALARAWLQKNSHNRNISERQVSQIADDITEDRYETTHQGVAFNCDETLLDGQHRLSAIVQANKGVWMLVTRGLPRSVSTTIDCGRVRSLLDVIGLAGLSDLHEKKIATGSIWMVAGPGSFKHPTRRSKLDHVKKHKEALLWAFKHYPTNAHGIGRAPVFGCIARAWYTVPHKKLARFCEVLQDPTKMESSDEKVIVRLHNALIGSKQAGHGWQFQNHWYKVTQRFLKAYLDGEDLKKTVSSDDDLFPLPAETPAS